MHTSFTYPRAFLPACMVSKYLTKRETFETEAEEKNESHILCLLHVSATCCDCVT